VAAPSLAVFKAGWDKALSNLVWWKMSLPAAERLGLVAFGGFFQPRLFCEMTAGML